MKLVKKCLIALAALATVMAFTGCGDMAGVGKTSGTKYNKTYTVDATGELKNADATWRRYVKQIGSKEEVAEIETTITIYKDFAKNDAAIFDVTDTSKSDGKAKTVVGFIVDYNKNATDDTVNDFVVFGFRPSNKTAYLGPYSAIKLGKDVEMDTENGSLVDTKASPKAKSGTEYFADGAISSDRYTVDDDGNIILQVAIKQETPGTYQFYLGGKKFGSSWKGSTISTKDKTKGMAIGGVAGYINVPKGAKVKVNYKTDSKKVTGSLFADEEEF